MSATATSGAAGPRSSAALIDHFPSLTAGALSGAFLLVWSHNVLATFGGSLVVTTAMAVATGLGVVMGLRLPMRSEWIRRFPQPSLWLIPALWTVALPWLLDLATKALSLIPASLFASEASALCTLMPLVTVLFGIPVTCLVALNWRLSSNASKGLQPDALPAASLLGCSASLLICALIVAPLAGVQFLGWVAAAGAGASFWIGLTRERTAEWPEQPSDLRTAPISHSLDRFDSLTAGLLALVAGAELAIGSRLVMQMMPVGPYLHVSLWCGVMGGMALAGLQTDKSQRKRDVRSPQLKAMVLTACYPPVILLAYPLLLRGLLWTSANVSSVALLTGLRSGLVALAGLPLGWAWCSVCTLSSRGPQHVQTDVWLPGVGWGIAGLLMVRSAWPNPALMLGLLPGVPIALWARAWWRSRSGWGRRDLIIATGLATSAIGAMLLRVNCRPDLAARLLFSTDTFAAYSQGTELELLPHLDDGRLFAVADGANATWTVWRTQGVRLHLRRDGMPAGTVSTSPRFCPQSPGEVMHAAVPLVVHRQPESVLLLGAGSSVTLMSCLSCPIRHVTCVENDHDLLRVINEIIGPMSGSNALADDRVHLRTVDPTLAVLADTDQYDVILSTSAQPAHLLTMAHFTKEWCQRIADRLKPGGILCQRLSCVDYGRKPIEDAIGTMCAVFPQVICQESAPGEVLLLATNMTEPLVDTSLAERCEAPHIRRLMAQLGWDWSVMLNLAAVQRSSSNQASGPEHINTVANGRFAYQLPLEVMRWGPKWQEVRSFWMEHGESLLAWMSDSPDTEEIVSRLSDMTEQHRLIIQHPDRFWMYRDTLKQRLVERPRAQIQQVKHEGLHRTLHPEDERRKDYLMTLGEAATDGTAPAIRRLADFCEPYDPLVSYFLHREAARLYDEAERPDLHAQLDHLRYSIYFAPPQDRSVRNVADAIELILEHDDLVPSSEDRWDQLNGLLEILKHRLALRSARGATSSRFEVVDTEKTITAARRAVTELDHLRVDAGIASADWTSRRIALERHLIRPLRTYYAKQARELAAIHAQQRQVADSLSTETETE